VTLRENGEITFENHAAWLDEVQTSRLFNRFYTVENAHNATGLGLSIAYEIIKAHGGSIQVTDAEGGGSCFTVVL